MREHAWPGAIPRWVGVGALIVLLTGAILLTAQVTDNWTIVTAAAFIGAMAGPMAFLVWLDDRSRIGRSVAPDALFITWLVGGGVAIVFVGLFQPDYLHHSGVGGYLWIAATDGAAKLVVPLVVCTLVPKYRSIERALVLALMSAAGFAVMESLTYAIAAYGESVQAVRNSLIARSVIAPFGVLPWTAMAVLVGARVWNERQRITFRPKALWGLGLAIVLHATVDAALGRRGWWDLLVIPSAIVTFAVMYHLVSGVYYSGPYMEPKDYAAQLHRVGSDLTRERGWPMGLPRWVGIAVLVAGLTGAILLTAQLTQNFTIVPAAAFIGAMTGPLVFLVWLDDRARIGRSVAPDVLFIVWLVGGGVAMIFAGVFESDRVYHAGSFGNVWIAATEEAAKILIPLAICTALPKYRPVERALSLALVSAAGFAVTESLAYAVSAYQESRQALRNILIERSVLTPFAHLPWTAMAVIVAARVWNERQRVTLTPKALWGFGLAIVLHATWNTAVAGRGWWHLLVVPTAVITFAVMYHLVSGVYYDGPYAIPKDHAALRHHVRTDP
jgi:RsiW-degrading membrane proteinase PrsW (M82 family)